MWTKLGLDIPGNEKLSWDKLDLLIVESCKATDPLDFAVVVLDEENCPHEIQVQDAFPAWLREGLPETPCRLLQPIELQVVKREHQRFAAKGLWSSGEVLVLSEP